MITRNSISARLLASFLVVLGLFIGLAGFAIIGLASVNRIAAELKDHALARTALLGEITDLISEIRIADAAFLFAGSGNDEAMARATLDKHLAALEAHRAQYRPLIASPEERSLFDRFDQARGDYLAEQQAFLAVPKTDRDRALSLYNGALLERYVSADAAADALANSNAATAEAWRAKAGRITGKAMAGLLAMAALGIAVTLGMIYVMRRRIAQPLSAITGALSELASGNLDVRIPETGRTDEIGAMAHAFEVFRRNAKQLAETHRAMEQAQELAQSLARHDALTGLPNRRLLAEDLQKAVARVARGGGSCAVLVIDLDRFKPVNDIRGHATGDLVLCEIGERLKRVARTGEKLARLGGDEFAAIVELAASTDAPAKLAGRIIAAVKQPIMAGSSPIEVGATIGIALCPNDGTDADSLLRAADLAMYRGKREGRGTFRFFERGMDLEVRSRATLEAALRKAIAAGDIRPHYQPLIRLGDSSLRGFEILARWHDAEKGLIMPDAFISVAEEAGLMPDLTFSVLRRACRDAKHWPQHLTLALNVSPSQLKDPWLPQALLLILSEEGFAPQRLEVEVTETALVDDIETARAILTSLQNVGVRVVLDDFGTGYSSLYHLRELKFDRIKIDRSFVLSVFDNPESSKIVDAIIGLGKSLGLPTTAEGIEDVEHLRRLVDLGCEYGQGYYFGKAMPSAEAATFIKAQRVAAGEDRVKIAG